MTPASYQATLAMLYRREAVAGIDLELGRVERVARALGSPHRRFPLIHVAGTNGKGSTASAAAAVLEKSGYRVGLYTSPHLVSFRERIRIGKQLISAQEVVGGVAEVDEAARLVLGPAQALTFFETATLLGFSSLARHRVDIAIVEVGLGGRLDATNIVDPQVAVVTPVALDHERFLGSRLAGIAAEKAAIIKPGKPVVTAAQEPEARGVIRAAARERGSPLREAGRDFVVECRAPGRFDFRGERWLLEDLRVGCEAALQSENAGLALAALEAVAERLEISESAIRAGLASWRWPGRFHVVGTEPRVILDGAHNPAATRALLRQLGSSGRGSERWLLFGAMKDKRWKEMVAILRPHVDAVVLTHVDGERGEDPQAIARAFEEGGGGQLRLAVLGDPQAALDWLLARAGSRAEVLITGSLFLVGELLPRFDQEFSRLRRAEETATRSLPVG